MILTRHSVRILTHFNTDIVIILLYYDYIAFYIIIIIIIDALKWLAIFWKEIQSLRDRESLLKSQLMIFGINYPDSLEIAELDKVNVTHLLLECHFPMLVYLYDFPTLFYSRRM